MWMLHAMDTCVWLKASGARWAAVHCEGPEAHCWLPQAVTRHPMLQH